MNKLKKKYINTYKLDDGNYMVSTKKSEVYNVDYYAHTNIDEVYGMEGNWGLIDNAGNTIIKPKYIYPFLECGNNYQVMLPNQYKIINGQKKIFTLKHGLIDKYGNIIIPIKYLYMEVMDNTGTLFRVVDRHTYKSGVIDKTNHVIIPFNYDYIQASPDLSQRIRTKYCDIYPDNIYQVKVSNNNLFGIYDLKLKKEIITPKYKILKIIDYNKFLVGNDYNNHHTLINEKEEIIINDINEWLWYNYQRGVVWNFMKKMAIFYIF